MRPTHSLTAIKEAVAQRGVAAFTRSALVGISEAGLTTDEARVIIAAMSPTTFYKTMPSELRPGEWQDVYRVPSTRTELYVKFVMRQNGKVVISFKPR